MNAATNTASAARNPLLDSLQLFPPQVIAAALSKGCAQLSTDRPEIAQRMLAQSWLDIFELLGTLLTKRPEGHVAASLLFIDAYFTHKGNWKAMELEMLEGCKEHRIAAERLVATICADLKRAAELIK